MYTFRNTALKALAATYVLESNNHLVSGYKGVCMQPVMNFFPDCCNPQIVRGDDELHVEEHLGQPDSREAAMTKYEQKFAQPTAAARPANWQKTADREAEVVDSDANRVRAAPEDFLIEDDEYYARLAKQRVMEMPTQMMNVDDLPPTLKSGLKKATRYQSLPDTTAYLSKEQGAGRAGSSPTCLKNALKDSEKTDDSTTASSSSDNPPSPYPETYQLNADKRVMEMPTLPGADYAKLANRALGHPVVSSATVLDSERTNLDGATDRTRDLSGPNWPAQGRAPTEDFLKAALTNNPKNGVPRTFQGAGRENSVPVHQVRQQAFYPGQYAHSVGYPYLANGHPHAYRGPAPAPLVGVPAVQLGAPHGYGPVHGYGAAMPRHGSVVPGVPVVRGVSVRPVAHRPFLAGL